MKVVICASIVFTPQIKETADALLELGYEVEIPFGSRKILKGEILLEDFLIIKQEKGDVDFKKEGDVIRGYFHLIKDSDAVLVLNYDKSGVKNYIGGNTLIEMAFAHVLDKKIFLLNSIPDISYKDEIVVMEPIVLDGDLSKIS